MTLEAVEQEERSMAARGLEPGDMRFTRCMCLAGAVVGLVTMVELGMLVGSPADSDLLRRCEESANATWENPGGVSAGLSYCIQKFTEINEAGGNAYELIDGPNVAGVRRQRLEGLSVAWKASYSASDPEMTSFFMSQGSFPSTGLLDDVEWLLPKGYRQSAQEARIVFVHGGAAQENALGKDYAGLTMRLANWTGMPVLSFNYPTEPVVPWPGNIRSVFRYMAHALQNGPSSAGRAGSLFLVADSEGTLVAMQTVVTLFDSKMLRMLGYGKALENPASWLAGVVLSTAVVDVSCETASFAWNCYDAEAGTGDPDTGDCSETPTLESRIQDCRWSYLTYFYGLSAFYMAKNNSAANAEWEARRDFFEMGLVNPMRANLAGLPPLLLIGATRDYFYSDSVDLGRKACQAGVDVQNFNALGTFHDFIEYSDGCGGPNQVEEALEAYRLIRNFAVTRAAALSQRGQATLAAREGSPSGGSPGLRGRVAGEGPAVA